MAEPTMSPGARSLLAAYRDDGRPNSEIVRRSWRAVRERVSHPEVAAREAWALTLPAVDTPYGEEADEFDDEFFDAVPARPGLFHYAKAAATSVAIAAAVLLCARVVVTSATTMTQEARDTARQAPYQGGVSPEQGRASVADPPPATPKAVKRAPATGVAQTVAPVPAAEPTAPVAEPAPEAPTPVAAKPRKARTAKAKPAATQVDDIAAELGLVKDATQAKNRGDTAKALKLLGEHAERFPSGALSQERQVLRAEVLCARGQRSQAKGLAERFAARHPTSALLGRMNGVCAD